LVGEVDGVFDGDFDGDLDGTNVGDTVGAIVHIGQVGHEVGAGCGARVFVHTGQEAHSAHRSQANSPIPTPKPIPIIAVTTIVVNKTVFV